jgi:transcriptional regulator with XRE-family HTH domain
MAKKAKSRAYAREWLESVNLKQSDLVRLLGWSKAKANAVWHGEQRLNEDLIDELAPLVHARPFELLMSPADANRFRNLDAALRSISTPTTEPDAPAPAATPIRRRA